MQHPLARRLEAPCKGVPYRPLTARVSVQITAFCGITPLTFSGSSFSSAAAEPAAEETASA